MDHSVDTSARAGATAGAEYDVTRRLVQAGVTLSSATSLDELLQVLVDIARDLVGARYAALGVIDETGTALSNFITSGLDDDQRARLGRLPTGHGILGLLIDEARPIRLRDLRDHPASAGVPEEHPSMRAFLGVPIMSHGRAFGNLYVTEKAGADEFDERDLAVLEMLAAQAAVAVENARLRRERERFFAAVSHELGNAIAGVNLWARQLLRRPPDDTGAWSQGVTEIRRAAEDAQRLIEDLLHISKIQEGRLRLNLQRFDLGEIVDEVVDHYRHEALAAELAVRVASPVRGVRVLADPARVRQVLVNLLSNALKYTPAGGTVELGLDSESAAEYAVVMVRDSGPGIDSADLERVFLPYEQVSTVARGRGIGLGLPLSRKLARLMDGDLWAESRVGHGSTFKLRLPLATRTDGDGDGAGL